MNDIKRTMEQAASAKAQAAELYRQADACRSYDAPNATRLEVEALTMIREGNRLFLVAKGEA